MSGTRAGALIHDHPLSVALAMGARRLDGPSSQQAPKGANMRARAIYYLPVLLAAVASCSDSGGDDSECGAYEETATDGCQCIEGYTKAGGNCIATNLTIPDEELPQQTGVDTPCTSAADCAGFDANFCEMQVSGSCLVQACDPLDPKACSPGHHCCTFTSRGLPNLCVSAELSGGVCR